MRGERRGGDESEEMRLLARTAGAGKKRQLKLFASQVLEDEHLGLELESLVHFPCLSQPRTVV